MNKKQMPEASDRAGKFREDLRGEMMTKMKWETQRKGNKMLSKEKRRKKNEVILLFKKSVTHIEASIFFLFLLCF